MTRTLHSQQWNLEVIMNVYDPSRVARLPAVLFALVLGAAPTWAADSFGQAVAVGELAAQRGGESNPTDSFSTITTIDSKQTLTAENGDNSISAGGDVTSGTVTIAAGALSDLHGMTNVVINSAPQSNVQGAMTLNLILQQLPQQ
jgi:hypothetical protein